MLQQQQASKLGALLHQVQFRSSSQFFGREREKVTTTDKTPLLSRRIYTGVKGKKMQAVISEILLCSDVLFTFILTTALEEFYSSPSHNNNKKILAAVSAYTVLTDLNAETVTCWWCRPLKLWCLTAQNRVSTEVAVCSIPRGLGQAWFSFQGAGRGHSGWGSLCPSVPFTLKDYACNGQLQRHAGPLISMD